MERQSSNLSPILERHSPQHPLPQEIQKMNRDETVCQFCGVSYLIHHEMKKLEEKIVVLEKELELCRGSVEREVKLKQELIKCKNALTQSNNVITEKDTIINKLTFEIDRQNNKIKDLKNENANLTKICEEKQEQFKLFKNSLKEKAKKISNKNSMLKENIEDIKQKLEESTTEFQSYYQFVTQKVEQLVKSCFHEIKCMSIDYEKLQFVMREQYLENDKLKNEFANLQQSIDNQKNHLHNEKDKYITENENLSIKIKTLENEISGLKNELGDSNLQVRKINSEVLQLKEVLNQKQNDLQNAIQKLNKTEHSADQTIQRLNQEIRHMERDLLEANKERDKLRKKEEERLRRENEFKSKMSESAGELDQLREAIESKKKECSALRQEREQMVMTHQHQISQLRDSFQEKLDSAQGNPLVFKKEIEHLKVRHTEELESLETRLRENFNLEWGLQKEKNEEYIASLCERHREEIDEQKSSYHDQIQTQMNEASVARQQLDAMKLSFSIEKQDHSEECKSLKWTISQLEEKVAEAITNHAEQSMNGKADIEIANEKLKLSEEEIERLQKHITELEEEISVLQETVRRECEERFELTEALSEVQQQLQMLKSGQKGLPRTMSSPRLPVSVLPNNGDVASSMQLSKKTLKSLGDNIRQTRIEESTSPSSSPIHKSGVANVREVSFNGNSSVNGSFLRNNISDVSVEHARKRIAAAIKKR